MALEQLENHVEKIEAGPISHTISKNQLKIEGLNVKAKN